MCINIKVLEDFSVSSMFQTRASLLRNLHFRWGGGVDRVIA